MTAVIEQLDNYIEGTDISKLILFDDSTTLSVNSNTLSIEEKYDIEAKLVYRDTKAYQEFQAYLK